MHSFQRRRWQWVIGLCIGLLVYAYIGQRLWRDWQSLDFSQFQLRYELLGISWLVHAFGTLLAIWTWTSLLQQMGYRLSFRRHINVYTASNLARRLPGFVWWIVGRAWMYDRDGIGKIETSAGTLLEMLLSATAAAVVALLTMWLAPMLPITIHPFALIGVVLCLLLLLHPRLFALVRTKFKVAATVPSMKWRYLTLWLLCEMSVVVLGGSALYFMLAAIYPVTPTALFGAIQGWALLLVSGTLLVWLPIDFGISSGVLVLVLSAFLPTPVALVIVIAWRWWATICELIWSVFGFALSTTLTKPSE